MRRYYLKKIFEFVKGNKRKATYSGGFFVGDWMSTRKHLQVYWSKFLKNSDGWISNAFTIFMMLTKAKLCSPRSIPPI